MFVRERERNREYEITYEQPTGSLGANKESQISRNSLFSFAEGFLKHKTPELTLSVFP